MEIEGIDYSQPGYKEMFANYGLTAIAALSLEKTIWLLVTAIENLGKNSVSIEEIKQQIGKHKKKPMGPLIGALLLKIEISPHIIKDLKGARDKRNFIIHHFFTDRVDNLRTDATLLSNELRPIRDFFTSIHTKVDTLLGEVIGEMNKPFERIKPELRKRLKLTAG